MSTDGPQTPGPASSRPKAALLALVVMLVAAVVIVGVFVVTHRGGNDAGVRSEMQSDLGALQHTIDAMTPVLQGGQPVSTELLRRFAEQAGRINLLIEESPEAIPGSLVNQYQVMLEQAEPLSHAKPEPGGAQTYAVAVIEYGQGLRSIALYYGKRPDQIPPVLTATPTATKR